MIQKLLLAVTLLISMNLLAQDNPKKWSVAVNYPFSVGDELGNDAPGIVDIGLKYRFLDSGIVKFGAGLNVGVFNKNIRTFTDPELSNFDETNWVFQPKVFAEFTIPTLKNLHPSIGLGYTIIRSRFDGFSEGLNFSGTSSDSNGGFNLNFGLSYDISKRFFIQAQYDYIRYNIRYNNVLPKINDNLGILKIGVGFRF